jgi:hypothetical protein
MPPDRGIALGRRRRSHEDATLSIVVRGDAITAVPLEEWRRMPSALAGNAAIESLA